MLVTGATGFVGRALVLSLIAPPSCFVDQQARGPYALWWHEHLFYAEGPRTRMVDRVSYAVPFGMLGQLANALVVRSTLRSIFAYRTEAIQRLFGERLPPASRLAGGGVLAVERAQHVV